MTTNAKTERIAARIEKLRELGFVRKRSPHEVRSLFFAVSKTEYETAKEGYFALMERYGVPIDDMLLIKEALSYMYYHMLTDLHGEHDLKNEELAAKVKWQ